MKVIEAVATELAELLTTATTPGAGEAGGGDAEMADMFSLDTVRDTLEAALEKEIDGGEYDKVIHILVLSVRQTCGCRVPLHKEPVSDVPDQSIPTV